MRSIYTTDEHVTERQPKNRTDILLDSMFAKFAFIGRYLDVNLDIGLWVMGGDLFDSNVQSSRLINRLIKVFKGFNRQDIFPILAIPGNHLIKGNKELSIEQSGLQLLEEAGYIKILPDPWIGKCGEYNVMMHHHAIVEKEVYWDHMTYEEVAATGACDYCLCSHNHTPYPVATVGNTMFIAPGSLSRGTGTEKNLHRPPQFAVFNLDGEKKCEYVTCQDKVTYPFIDRAESTSFSEANDMLIDNIKTVMDEYTNKSIEFKDLHQLLVKKKVISPEGEDYLLNVREIVRG